MTVNFRSCINTKINDTQGVPHKNVLSTSIFNIILASLPGYFLQSVNVMVYFVLYADDHSLGCVGSTTRGSAARNALQRGIL